MAHYSLGQRPLILAQWAKAAASDLRKTLEKEFGRHARPIFVYRGMSGVAHATALSLEWERRQQSRIVSTPCSFAYVRKDSEKSHGSSVEFQMAPNDDAHPIIPIFVDDFVSSGDTRKVTMKKFHSICAVWLGAAWTAEISQDKFIQVTATSAITSPAHVVRLMSWAELSKVEAV